jgi:hypothetical protein
MSDIQLKTIRNTTGVPQNLIYRGRQFILGPNDEQTFEQAIADAFLEKCAPMVTTVQTELGAAWAPELQKKTIWVANMTGNPDAAPTVKDRRYDRTSMKYQEVDVVNPNLKPHPISREMKGGHKQYTARDGGLVQEAVASKIWVIPQYRRVPMPEEAAEWFLNRDAMQGPSRGAVIRSRERTAFEPDMSWQYNDMQNYARLVDPSMNVGPSDAELAKTVKAEVDLLAKEHEWTSRKIENELRERGKEALRRAKNELYQRLYFRLVNPDYPLPTRTEYNEFVTGKTAADIEDDEFDAMLAAAERQNRKAEKEIEQAASAEA